MRVWGTMIKSLKSVNKFTIEAKLGQNGLQIWPEDTVKGLIIV